MKLVDEPEEQQIEEIRPKPILEKDVRRNHTPDQIIGNKESRIMTRNKLRNQTCSLCDFKPKLVKYSLDNEDWIHVMGRRLRK